jgi:hypothetical protein
MAGDAGRRACLETCPRVPGSHILARTVPDRRRCDSIRMQWPRVGRLRAVHIGFLADMLDGDEADRLAMSADPFTYGHTRQHALRSSPRADARFDVAEECSQYEYNRDYILEDQLSALRFRGQSFDPGAVWPPPSPVSAERHVRRQGTHRCTEDTGACGQQRGGG